MHLRRHATRLAHRPQRARRQRVVPARGLRQWSGAFTSGIGRSAAQTAARLRGDRVLYPAGPTRRAARCCSSTTAPSSGIGCLRPAASFSYFRASCYAEGVVKGVGHAQRGAGDGLSSERRYATRTLPRGVARGLADACRGHATGLGRAGAIAAGLAATTAGYAAGLVQPAQRRIQRAPPGRPHQRTGGADESAIDGRWCRS